MTWSTETFKSKGSVLPCERIDRESQQYPKISTQLNFLDVTPPKSAHKYQSKRSRWPFRRQCFICCCPERKSPIYSMRRRTAGNPRTPPQHQIGSETHLISTEASAWALRQLWHVPAALCALNEKASHEQTLCKLNTTTTHNTQHAASEDSVSFWPWNIKDNSACRTRNVMFCSHLFLNRLFIMNIHKRYATFASSLEVYMFMGQATLLTLKRETLVLESLVLNVGHERICFSDWCWRRIPHGGSKRSINKLLLQGCNHIHSSDMHVFH